MRVSGSSAPLLETCLRRPSALARRRPRSPGAVWRCAGKLLGPARGWPLGARLTAHCLSSLSDRYMLARRYDEAADLAREGLDVIERHRTDQRALLKAGAARVRVGIAAALCRRSSAPPQLDVVVTTRTNRAAATCTAPNCAGHRARP